MKTITVGFSKSSLKFAPFSWLIMWAQKTPYSHVYLKFEKGKSGKVLYYQASHDLVNMMSQDIFLNQESVIEEFTFELSDEDFNDVKDECYADLGKPYSTKEILGLAYVILCGWMGFKVKNPIHDGTSSFFCSELIAYILQKCINVQLPQDFEDMTPKDMYPVIKALPRQLS